MLDVQERPAREPQAPSSAQVLVVVATALTDTVLWWGAGVEVERGHRQTLHDLCELHQQDQLAMTTTKALRLSLLAVVLVTHCAGPWVGGRMAARPCLRWLRGATTR